MYYYSIYGNKVCSDLFFPQLITIPQIEKEQADIVIVSGVISQDIKKMEQEKKWSFGEERSWLANRTCWFCVEKGKTITYELKEGAREDYLRTYLLGFGMAMLHLQRGEMAIHCSALSKDGKAVLIAGDSGSGKSTTTTALLDKGYTLMADDMAIVKVNDEGKVICYPAFPFQKLCRNVVEELEYDLNSLIYIDEDKDKFLVPRKNNFDTNGKELEAFFYLAVTKELKKLYGEEITGIQKWQAYLRNLFLGKLLGQEIQSPQIMQTCLALASKTNMYILARPVEGDTLAERVEFIISKM